MTRTEYFTDPYLKVQEILADEGHFITMKHTVRSGYFDLHRLYVLHFVNIETNG